MTAALVLAAAGFVLPPVPKAPGVEAWTFRQDLAAGVPAPCRDFAKGRAPWLENRISRCCFGPIKRPPFNRDELMDDVDYYPDAYLRRLASEGVNGLWLTVEFRDLAETSFTRRLPDAERRIGKLRETVAKCARRGIKVWLFAIEPHIFRNDDPFVKEHPEVFGPVTIKGGKPWRVVCTSKEAGRRYLEESTRDIFTQVPGLGGLINISHGERTTSCLSYLYPTNDFMGHLTCEGCSTIPPWQIHWNTLSAMEKGVHAANPDASVISWLYHSAPWTTRGEWVYDIARHMPPRVTLQYNFEAGALKEQEGKRRVGGDYWLSWPGPCDNFKRMAEGVRNAGGRLSAKIQVGCSHEVATVPYVPAPGLLYRKYRAMRLQGVKDVMQCWYFGSYPGVMNKAAGMLAYEDFSDGEEAFLVRLAADEWGADAPRVVRIWQAFARGYENYPMSNCFQYYGPVHAGATWPLYADISCMSLQPTWQPYRLWSGDAIGECLENHTLDEALALFRKACSAFAAVADDIAALERAYAENAERLGDLRVMRALALQFESAKDILSFYSLRRDALAASRFHGDHHAARRRIAQMRRIVAREREIADQLAVLSESDSRLGFHAEAESHLYHPAILRARRDTLSATDRRLCEISEIVSSGRPWPLSEAEQAAPTMNAAFDVDGNLVLEGEAPDGGLRVQLTDVSVTDYERVYHATAKNGRFALVVPSADWNDDLRRRPGWVRLSGEGWAVPEGRRPMNRLRLRDFEVGCFARLVFPAEAATDRVGRAEAEALHQTWCDAIMANQIASDDPTQDGALACPACGFLHGRVADVIWPLTRTFVRTGDVHALDAAERAVRWCERNMLRKGGFYVTNQQSKWIYTTVFAQIAVGRTLLTFGDRLPDELRRRWTDVFRRQSEFVLEYFTAPGDGPNVNYLAAFCEGMALAWKQTGKETFRRAGIGMIESRILPLFTDDGLLAGEGRPLDGRSPDRGLAFVDIAYNLEESLPALAAASDLFDHAVLADAVLRSAAAHAAFMLPDGGMDAATGSRAAKWTYYGSRTSDGALPLWAWCARRGVPWAVRMVDRTLSLMRDCTTDDGLLAGGPDYAAAGEPACVHHTFTHVKALTEILEHPFPAALSAAPLPREQAKGVRHVKSMDVDLVSVGPWRATFSANDAAKSGRRRQALGGGSLALLWHERLGPVAVGTPARFSYVEPHNMQDQRHDFFERSMTPRLECVTDTGVFSNLPDHRVNVSRREEGDVFVCVAEGTLTAADDDVLMTNGTFRIEWRLSPHGLDISAVSSVPCAFEFPVTVASGLSVTDDKGLDLQVMKTDRGETAFSTVGGFLYRIYHSPAATSHRLHLKERRTTVVPL